MEQIIIIGLIFIAMTLIGFAFKINKKQSSNLAENKELEELTNKFPDNITIAKEMLEMLKNDKVKVEELKTGDTSLYVAPTNKILIANIKNNYSRIYTIAHECMHSVQDRRLLLFNFIFSNIILIFWIISVILTLLNKINNIYIIISAMLIMALVKLAVRGYLETYAMLKARYFSEKYIEKKAIITNKEKDQLVLSYEEINKIGIPFSIAHIITGSLIGILAYTLISII